jgi:hypothetical protein
VVEGGFCWIGSYDLGWLLQVLSPTPPDTSPFPAASDETYRQPVMNYAFDPTRGLFRRYTDRRVIDRSLHKPKPGFAQAQKDPWRQHDVRGGQAPLSCFSGRASVCWVKPYVSPSIRFRCSNLPVRCERRHRHIYFASGTQCTRQDGVPS